MAVSDYSTTPGSNTSISGINIAEGCPAGNLNNAIRQLMADLKAAGYAPLAGAAFTGGITGTDNLSISGGTAFFDNLLVQGNGTDGYIRAANGSGKLFLGAGNASVVQMNTNGSIAPLYNLPNTFGYLGLPANAQTGAYTLVIGDMGKHISITTGGVVIPANGSVAFPIGTAIVVYNDSASSQTITITTDTLRLAGTGTTGARTLAGYGLATLVKVGTTTWVASGSGVS